MKRTFVELQLLIDLTYEGDTAEDNAAWLRNVTHTGVEHGYTFSGNDGYDTEDFACDEMEFADVQVYDFMGSEHEQERFYTRDIVTFKNKANGKFYVLHKDDLGEF